MGIDFGTTTTGISLWDGNTPPKALPIGSDGITPYIPSIVYIPSGHTELSREVVVGEQDESNRVRGTFIHSIKRCLGCVGDHCASNYAKGCHWCKGDGMVNLENGYSVAPERIAYLIIREALQRAKRIAQEEYNIDLTTDDFILFPTNVGCGAAFDLRQRSLLMQIAQDLGFKRVKLENIVEEPVLAGFAFSRFESSPEGRILIYDFGGGSFDVAVLDISRGADGQRITVLATAGENWLGGDDIDALVQQHFLRQMAKHFGMTVNEVEAQLEPIDIWELRKRAKHAKETLSSIDNYADVFIAYHPRFSGFPLDLTRTELEKLILNSKVQKQNLIDRSLDTVLWACKLVYAFKVAKEKPEYFDSQKVIGYQLSDAAPTIDRVVLVGGVTKIPLVRNTIASIFGESKIEKESVIEPITAVAIGAAYPLSSVHYSIAHPPFEILMAYGGAPDGTLEYKTVFLPYEPYEFHSQWATSSGLPSHASVPIVITESHEFGQLLVKKIGDSIDSSLPLRPMQTGKWQFFVGLDGEIRYKVNDSELRELGHYPTVHPEQKAIVDAREADIKQKQKEAIETLKENAKKILLEN